MKYILPLILIYNYSIAQISWQKFGTGVPSGLINTAYIYNNANNNIIIGTDNNGILFSNDNGLTWTALNNGLPVGSSITSIDVHSTSGKVLAVASGVVYVTNSNPQVSSNVIWSELNNASTSFSNANLVFVDAFENIWAFSKNNSFETNLNLSSWTNTGLTGVWGIGSVCQNGNGYPSVSWGYGIATYDGSSWSVSNLSSTLLQDLNYQSITNYTIGSNGIAYYGSSNGIFSYSSGFVNLSNNLPNVPYSASVSAPVKINDILYLNGDVFVATQDVSTSKREGNIYKLASGSNTWVKLGNGLPQDIFKYYKIFTASNGSSANLYALGTEGLFMSQNAGATWNSISNNAPVYAGIKSFTFLNNGSIVAATLTGKLYLSDPSVTNWQNITSQLFSGSIGHVKADGNNVIYVSSGFAPPGMSSSTAGLFYSNDLGITWTKAFPADRASLLDINITPLNEVYFGGNFDPAPDGVSIHYSNDSGNTWTIKNVNNGSAGSIFCANKVSNGYLLAGSETGGVLRSTDNGTTFQSISNTTGKAGNVLRIDLAPWGDLFTSFDYTRGMYLINSSSLISTSPNATQLTNYPTLTNTLDVAFGNTNNVYFATDKGFYSSADNGTTLIAGNAGIHQQKILRLAVNKFDGHLYMSNAEGIFKSNSAIITGVKADQTITFNALDPKTLGDQPFTLNATASSGLPVSYASSNASVATISGNVVTIVGAGSCDITASQDGDANYNAALSVTQTLVVNPLQNKADQTITFNALDPKTLGDQPFTLNAIASSGLPVSYVSSNASVATISGNVVTIVGAGSCDITASQDGDANYNAALSVTQTLVVNPLQNKADQTITFNALDPKTLGDQPFTLNATASSGLPVSYASSNASVATISGDVVTIVGAGSCDITASQDGDANYNAALSVTQTLVVNALQNKTDQSITFNALDPKTLGDQPFTLNAIASSGLPVSYVSSNASVATISGNVVTIVGAGSCDITASQDGDANYNAALSVTQTLVVNPLQNKADQTITFNALDPKTLGDQPFTLNATVSSGLPVFYSSSNLNVASVSANIVTINGEGSTNITASQPGDDTFNAAEEVTQTLLVKLITALEEPIVISRIYPNPTSTVLIINFYQKIDNTQIGIFDSNGDKINVPISKTSELEFTIDLSQLSNGLYILKLDKGNETIVRRILKND